MTSNFQKMKKNVGDEFENQMQNVTQQILADILVDRNVLGQQMLEIRSCLSHPCENGGTCHATSNTCMCLGGYAGAHCENCETGFKKKGDACIPDENVYKAMKPYQGSQYVLSTTSKNWNAARNACKKLKGDLVATETQEEWSQIFDEIKKLQASNYWLGATGQVD